MSIPPETTEPSNTPSKSRVKKFWQIFWLSFLVISLGYAWYSFYVPANDVVWAEDYATAQALALKSEKPIMLFFTADWCVPCRIMKREVFANDQVMQIMNERLVPLMLYAEDEGTKPLFDLYNVRGTPVTILTDHSGNVINYAVGGIGKAEFLKLIGAE